MHIVTDVADYFDIMRELLTQETALRPLSPPDPKEPAHDLDYLTNFDRKFRKEGRPIHQGVWERLESLL